MYIYIYIHVHIYIYIYDSNIDMGGGEHAPGCKFSADAAMSEEGGGLSRRIFWCAAAMKRRVGPQRPLPHAFNV